MWPGRSVRFAILFLVVFAVLFGAFEVSRGTRLERWVVEDGILRPTGAVINVLSPSDHVTVNGRTIASAGSALHVIRGCEGTELFLLLTAAVIAFPTNLRRKMEGLAMGFVLAYVLSVARLMALHYALQGSPRAWEALHGLVLPLIPVPLIALYFLRWS